MKDTMTRARKNLYYIVKLQAWEDPFREKTESLRKIEVNNLFNYKYNIHRHCNIVKGNKNVNYKHNSNVPIYNNIHDTINNNYNNESNTINTDIKL